MAVKEIRTQSDLYCLLKKIIGERTRFDEIEFSRIDLEYRIKPSRRRADLVVFFRDNAGEEKPFLVIEAKRSREHEDETDYSQKFVFPGLGEITLQEAMDKGLWDKSSFKYHMGALQQAKEYAQSIGAFFFAVCYADSLFVRSFIEQHGLFFSSVDFSEKFGLEVLNKLAQLYSKIRQTQN